MSKSVRDRVHSKALELIYCTRELVLSVLEDKLVHDRLVNEWISERFMRRRCCNIKWLPLMAALMEKVGLMMTYLLLLFLALVRRDSHPVCIVGSHFSEFPDLQVAHSSGYPD